MEPGTVVGHYPWEGVTCALHCIVTGWQSYCANLPYWSVTKKSHAVWWCSALPWFSYVSFASIIRCAQIFVNLIFVVEYYPRKLNPPQKLRVYIMTTYHIVLDALRHLLTSFKRTLVCYVDVDVALLMSSHGCSRFLWLLVAPLCNGNVVPIHVPPYML